MKKLLLLIAMMLTVYSTAIAETLTAESAVGTVGTLNGREAMVVDLGGSIGKVAVATRNVGATDVNDYGTQFSSEADFDPASLNLTDGWYVPTIEELSALKDILQPREMTGFEYIVGESVLYFPGFPHQLGGGVMYAGQYLSSNKTDTHYQTMLLYNLNTVTKKIGNFNNSYAPCAIRPFHKMPLVENCRIYYTSSDGNVIIPNDVDTFNVSIVSNTYDNGQGVIIFDGELTRIGNYAFSGKSTLTSVTLPASVTSIGDYAFNGCSSLATLTFAEDSQLETIGVAAFNTTAISGELTLPVSLKTIGDWAFHATMLTAVTLPASVTSIGRHAFSGTLISGELTLPASLKTIGESAFNGCSGLTKLTFAEGSQLKNIGGHAFAGTAISGELTLPASVTTIEGEAFGNCSLTKVYMSSEDLSGSYSLIFNAGAVIIVPAELYELYKNHFYLYNKVEVEPFSDWQEYTIAQIKAAMKTANTISDTDKTTIAGYISTIENATTLDGTLETYYAALALIDKQKAFEEKVKGVLGDLGTGHTGPAIRVTGKNGKSIMLFELDKVEFVNIDVIGQGEAEATGIGNVRWIQLWEGGPKFAEYNLGATSATEFGGYYTWGGMYKNGKGITWDGTYNEGSSVLSGEADTATNLWGSNWRMPTIEDFNNLLANCNAEWTTIDGVNGCKFTGKGDYKYNSIFLPAAGSCDGYPDSNAVVTNQGDRGYYFTSTPKASNIGHALMVTSSSQYLSACNRNTGNSIRAVLNEE